MTDRRLPPPVWLLAGLAVQRLLPGRRPPSTPSRVAAGTIGAASVALAATTAARFRAVRTTVHPLTPEHTTSLVTSGPNALSRNPMYVAMAGVLVADALRVRSVAALLPAAGLVALLDRTQVAAEERALRQIFGADYDAYARRVPRWVGPVR